MIIEGRITDVLYRIRSGEHWLNILFTDDTLPKRGYSTNLYGKTAEEQSRQLKNGDIIRVDGVVSEIDEEWNIVRRRYIEAVRVTRISQAVVRWVDVAPQIGQRTSTIEE